MSFKIGNVKINGQVIVAPMAGISNMTFRRICKRTDKNSWKKFETSNFIWFICKRRLQ